jgi:hypothetical protein
LGFKAAPKSSHHLKTVYQFSIAAVYQFTTAADRRQGPALVHQGSDGNWLAIAVLFPEQGTGALVVANAAPEIGAEKVLNTVIGALFPTLSPAKKALSDTP